MSAVMVCPKCAGRMRHTERGEILLERCTQCGGIFLDRGELERVIEAERGYYSRYERDDDFDDDYDDDDHRRGYSDGEHGRKRKKSRKRSFLEDILDFG